MSKESIPNTSISACTLLPVGLKFKLEDETDHISNPGASTVRTAWKSSANTTAAVPFLGYFLFPKLFLKPYSQSTSIVRTKTMAGKLYTGGLKQMIMLPVPKLSQMYFNGSPCVSTEPKISEL